MSSATASASNAGPTFADDAGTLTTQSSRVERGIAADFHEMWRERRYRFLVRRHCARPGCSAPATATFTFDTRDLTVWLDTPAEGTARAGELCERHVRALTPPQGWHLEDRRGARARAAEQLEATLDAHSPMLSRAFQNAGAV